MNPQNQPQPTNQQQPAMTNPPKNLFGANPSPAAAFQFQTFMQTAVDRLNTLDPLIKQKNMLFKQLYDAPLSPDELKTLPQPLQQAIGTGDRNEIEMQLRLMNDTIGGRANTLNQSIKFLTDGYQASVTSAETQRQNAWSALKDYVTASGDSTAMKKALASQYGSYFQGLGMDVNGFLNTIVPDTNTYSTSTDNNPLNLTLGSATQQYVDSGQATVKTGPEGIQFLSFKDPNVGMQAAKDLLFGKKSIYANMTVDQALHKWSDSAQKKGYGAEIVKGQGIDPAAFIRDLPPSQQDTLIKAMTQAEGGRIPATQQPTAQYSDLLSGKTPLQTAFFNSLSDNEKSNVYQLITGKALISDLAAGMGGAAARQRLLAEAQRIDPTFSENVNKRRYQFQTAWYSPTAAPFKTRTSINTSMGHLAQAFKDFQAIDNGTLLKYNSLKDMLSKETGNDAVTNFNYDLTQLASEIASAYKNGTAPTDQEVEQERAALAYNFSPKQGQGVFDRAAKLISSKITSMAEEYHGAMGKYPDDPIVQDFALKEMQDAGVNISPIVDTLKAQGYDMSQYQTTSPKTQAYTSTSGNTYNLPY